MVIGEKMRRLYSSSWFSAGLVFVYIVGGYWFVKFLFDPQSFLAKPAGELWIIPFAAIMAIIRYLTSRYAQKHKKS